MTQFESWIRDTTREMSSKPFEPHPWQIQLATTEQCRNRLIRIPTGLGKTLGARAATYVTTLFDFHLIRQRLKNFPIPKDAPDE